MRQFFNLLAAGLLSLLPMTATGQDRPVVVELFTSQGCSSCPPADAYLHKLAKRDDVIALAMHVDYWDYIGWKDIFASPELTERQRTYARVGQRRMVYTPQMIINGQDHVVGNRPRDVEDLIKQHSKADKLINLKAKRSGDKVMIQAVAEEALSGPVTIQLLRYKPQETVQIKRGENAGRSLSYANIVTDITELRNWNGRKALDISAKMLGNERGVILVQGSGQGAVMAAAWVQ